MKLPQSTGNRSHRKINFYCIVKTSRPEMFRKKNVFKNFAKVTEKIPVLESLFNKVSPYLITLNNYSIWQENSSFDFSLSVGFCVCTIVLIKDSKQKYLKQIGMIFCFLRFTAPKHYYLVSISNRNSHPQVFRGIDLAENSTKLPVWQLPWNTYLEVTGLANKIQLNRNLCGEYFYPLLILS